MINFSIIGLGHIGKVHKKAIEETKGAKLIAIIDPLCKQEDYACKVYKSLEDFLINDKETDVVNIATPNGFHKEHAILCLKAGKHVLIEKPMALSVKDAEEIMKIAEETGKRVFSSMQLRFSPPVHFVKNLLEERKLGKLYLVNIQCYWNRNENYYKVRQWSGSREMDGGVLFTQFSHFVDIMNYWFEETRCNHSNMFNFNHKGITEFPDSGVLEFQADEAIGNMIFTTSVYQKNYKSRILLIGEKGTVEIGDQYLNRLQYCNVEGVEAGEETSTEIKNFHPQAMGEVVRALNENRPSILDGGDAVRLVRFVEQAHLADPEN